MTEQVTFKTLHERCLNDASHCSDCTYQERTPEPYEFWGQCGTGYTYDCTASESQCPEAEFYLQEHEKLID